MEHCIDIEERTVNDNSNYIVPKINIDRSGLPVLDLNYCIHRVSEGLCRAKREAYEPMVVSIGPYHLKNPKLKAMKKHKSQYLHLLLERRKENVDRYVAELKKLEDRVRKCYVEPIDDDLNSEYFVEMMLLDACFIIEFFRKNSRNTILNVPCMEAQIHRDLMLLENQLPFFLLSHFYDMIKNPDDVPEYPKPDPDNNPNNGLLRLIAQSFYKFIPPPCLKNPEHIYDPTEIKHLLHLVHVFCCPLPKLTARSELTNTTNNSGYGWDEPMHSAVELEDAGVKFKMIGKYYNSEAHLFDITFADGLMEVPHFPVGDSTDTFFRNLIAFEQHSMEIVPKYFTEYASFMYQLIKSEKDVKLLRDVGIIANWLGDDKEVSNLFNNLCDGVVVPCPNLLHEVVSKVDVHYNSLWNKMRPAIRKELHGYFDNPFVTASTIAAVVLLVLTLLQTIAAFKYK